MCCWVIWLAPSNQNRKYSGNAVYETMLDWFNHFSQIIWSLKVNNKHQIQFEPDSGFKWAEWSPIIETDCAAEVFRLIAGKWVPEKHVFKSWSYQRNVYPILNHFPESVHWIKNHHLNSQLLDRYPSDLSLKEIHAPCAQTAHHLTDCTPGFRQEIKSEWHSMGWGNLTTSNVIA